MNYEITISEILTHLLQINNISEYELAVKINIPRQTINKIINRKTIDPKSSTLIKIAQFFNISVDELLGNVDTPSISCMTSDYTEINVLQINQLNINNIDNLSNIFSYKKIKLDLITNNSIEKFFAIISQDKAMMPKFDPNTILVFTNIVNIKKSCYVIAYIKSRSEFLFRKYMIISEHSCLVPIDTTFPIIKMLEGDVLVGKLIKSIMRY